MTDETTTTEQAEERPSPGRALRTVARSGVLAAGIGTSSVTLAEALAVVPDEWGPAGVALAVLGWVAWETMVRPLLAELHGLREAVEKVTPALTRATSLAEENARSIAEIKVRMLLMQAQDSRPELASALGSLVDDDQVDPEVVARTLEQLRDHGQ